MHLLHLFLGKLSIFKYDRTPDKFLEKDNGHG